MYPAAFFKVLTPKYRGLILLLVASLWQTICCTQCGKLLTLSWGKRLKWHMNLTNIKTIKREPETGVCHRFAVNPTEEDAYRFLLQTTTAALSVNARRTVRLRYWLQIKRLTRGRSHRRKMLWSCSDWTAEFSPFFWITATKQCSAARQQR